MKQILLVFAVLLVGLVDVQADSKTIGSLWTRTVGGDVHTPDREVTCTLTEEKITVVVQMTNVPQPVPAETVVMDYLDPSSPQAIKNAFDGVDEELVVIERNPDRFERVIMAFQAPMGFLLLEKLAGSSAMVRKGPKAETAKATILRECFQTR